MISDDDYLESLELNFFFKDVKRQMEQFRPEDPLDFTIQYFKQIQSCYHIIGTGYPYILESVHNRKALIFCLMESFKSFNDAYEITPNEIYHLIDMVCPSFPKSIVLEAAMLSVSNINHLATLVDTKCSFYYLFRNISCYILYDEWLKLVEECFRNDGKGMFLIPYFLKNKLEEIHRNLFPSIYQPPWAAIIAALETIDAVNITTPGISSSSSGVARNHDREISFDNFKKNLFKSRAVMAELDLIAQLPQNC